MTQFKQATQERVAQALADSMLCDKSLVLPNMEPVFGFYEKPVCFERKYFGLKPQVTNVDWFLTSDRGHYVLFTVKGKRRDFTAMVHVQDEHAKAVWAAVVAGRIGFVREMKELATKSGRKKYLITCTFTEQAREDLKNGFKLYQDLKRRGVGKEVQDEDRSMAQDQAG